MLDTMTFTKVLGGFCGAFLIFLLGKWVAEEVYAMGGGHGDEHAQGYVIEVADAGGAAEEEEGPDFATLLASADAGKGERVFKKCAACHKVDGEDATGPHLNGVVDRAIGSVAGFNYSGSLSAVGDVWSAENLNVFLENPKGAAPGTSMGFAGLRKVEDRADLVAYLQSISN
ncbi:MULTISPECIES: cytochrome c family protein [Donghicola]|jgi:cytochrome c|uniref:c-type cytochrome n=1 Tax=Donghicola sp. TaxID=1929294 RepID=UPI0025DFC563|nr:MULTISPECIES: cytochrome c family protein [Donghicola]MCI5042364.1 cytochrome c family protein [Donghicola eburneus]MCT4576999.1 cytochrome c family protein [Donghicola sp.]